MPPSKTQVSSRQRAAWGLSVVALGITALALVSTRYGWSIYLEILSHFQVQYLGVVLGLLGLTLLLRVRTSSLVVLACCIVLAAQVLPWYWPPQRLLPRPQANLRVLVANINAQNQQHEKVISLIQKEQPDVAVFMEVNAVWEEQFRAFQDQLPHVYGRSNPYNLGLLVYSRQPLIAPRIEYFGVDKNVSVVSQMEVQGQRLTLVATHPFPPAKNRSFHQRNQQLDQIGQFIKTVRGPVVMVGDLNLSQWSPYYRRLVSRTGLRNARNGFGVLPTWPNRRFFNRLPPIPTTLLAIPLDHCLISPEIQVSNIYVGTDTGSDHRPLVVDLQVRP